MVGAVGVSLPSRPMKQPWRSVLLGASTVLLLAASACGDKPGANACKTPADCGAGDTCEAGRCVPETSPDAGPTAHGVGGAVTGLLAGSQVVLASGGELLTVTAAGPFTFSQQVAGGASYAVTVHTQPEGHVCGVERGTGTMGGAAVTDVAVHCAAQTYAVSGTVTGLEGTDSVVLENNAGDALTITAPGGAFTFATPVPFGARYTVTARAQAPLVCDVTEGTGTMAAHAVTGVQVSCRTVIDCAQAPAKSLCVPNDGEALLYGAVHLGSETTLQLFRASPEGSVDVQLTPDGDRIPVDVNSFGARSPDRRTVAFVSGRDWPSDSEGGGSPSRGVIYLADADGGNARRLTQAPAVTCRENMPRFSHDGQWVYFWRSCDSDPVASSFEFLFRIRPDGSDELRIVDTREADFRSIILWGTPSRDGRTVYGLKSKLAGDVLVAYDLETGTTRDIFDSTTEGASIWGHPVELDNGDLLFMYRKEGSETQPSITRLERMSPEGIDRQPVRDLDLDPEDVSIVDIYFQVSPDGKRLAYVHHIRDEETGEKRASVWVSNVDGSEARQVSALHRFVFWLTWNK